MAFSASYLVDLSGVKFDEESTETWIQAMPLGEYEHPTYGTISITPERVNNFVSNVKTAARSQQLDIDYDHKEYSGEAAGWVKDAEARSNGLWLLVDWTKKAAQLIKDGAYRYFSPEFDDEWTHPKTQTLYKDVIFGGAITNRPFLKDIMPINLSEVFANVPPIKSNEGGSSMKPEQVKSIGVKLGLGESATEDQVMAKLEEYQFSPPTPPAVIPPIPDAAALAALEAAKKLGEGNPAIKSLMDLYTAQSALVESQGAQLAKFGKSLREQEVTDKVKTLNDSAKARGYVIPPALQESLTTTLLSLTDDALAKTVLDGFEKVVEAQVVALGEKGFLRGTHNEEGLSATEEYKNEIKKLTDGGKMSIADAAETVADTDPQLYSRYQKEAYAFGGES